MKLVQLVADGEQNVNNVVEVVEASPAIVSRLLAAANSAANALRVEATTARRAVVTLGVDRSVAIGVATLLQGSTQNAADETTQRYWRDAVLRGSGARALAEVVAPTLSGQADLVGLLQSSGVLLHLKRERDYCEILKEANGCMQRLAWIEEEKLGHTHVDALKQAIEAWHLPETLVEPLLRSHADPSLQPPQAVVDSLSCIGHIVASIPLGTGGDGLEHPAVADLARIWFGLNYGEFLDAMRAGLAAFEEMRQLYADMLPEPPDEVGIFEWLGEALSEAEEATSWLGDAPVAVVEPSRTVRNILERLLRALGAKNIQAYGSGAEALRGFIEKPPAVAFTSLHLPDMTAADMWSKMRGDQRLQAIGLEVMSSAATDAEQLFQGSDVGLMAKPVQLHDLKRSNQAYMDQVDGGEED